MGCLPTCPVDCEQLIFSQTKASLLSCFPLLTSSLYLYLPFIYFHLCWPVAPSSGLAFSDPDPPIFHSYCCEQTGVREIRTSLAVPRHQDTQLHLDRPATTSDLLEDETVSSYSHPFSPQLRQAGFARFLYSAWTPTHSLIHLLPHSPPCFYSHPTLEAAGDRHWKLEETAGQRIVSIFIHRLAIVVWPPSIVIHDRRQDRDPARQPGSPTTIHRHVSVFFPAWNLFSI